MIKTVIIHGLSDLTSLVQMDAGGAIETRGFGFKGIK